MFLFLQSHMWQEGKGRIRQALSPAHSSDSSPSSSREHTPTRDDTASPPTKTKRFSVPSGFSDDESDIDIDENDKEVRESYGNGDSQMKASPIN